MRATEIIRGLLDLIDKVEDQTEQATQDTYYDDEARRMDQVDDFTGSCDSGQMYANEPDETVGGIEVVTTLAGGGWQEPKHPNDIRGEHGRLHGGD